MNTCPWCQEQYDEGANDGNSCMSCQGNEALISGVGSLGDLPLHQVTEEGVNHIGQRYVRLRYADGGLVDRIPREEHVEAVKGNHRER